MRKKSWLIFSSLNALMGLFIGVTVALKASGEGYWMFTYLAPLAAFIVATVSWLLLVGNRVSGTKARVVGVGAITGTVSHYLTFVFMGIAMNICHWVTGGCVGAMGEAPANVWEMMSASFAFSFFSLLFFGWITVPGSILIGLFVRPAARAMA